MSPFVMVLSLVDEESQGLLYRWTGTSIVQFVVNNTHEVPNRTRPGRDVGTVPATDLQNTR
jgi:hypothetical protein